MRVNADLLDLQDYVAYCEGKPFTGVAVEYRPDGTVWSEITYRFGLEDGPARDWYENGMLRSESMAKLGVTNGISKEWQPDGTPKTEKVIELGYCTHSREWGETGRLIKESKLDENSSNYELLIAARAQEPRRVQTILERFRAA